MAKFEEGLGVGIIGAGVAVAALSYAIYELRLPGIKNESFERGELSGYQRAVCDNFLAENVEEISSKFAMQAQAGNPKPNVMESVTSVKGEVYDCNYNQYDVEEIREFAEMLRPE